MGDELPQVGAIPLDGTRTRFTVWAPRLERVGLVLGDSSRAEAMRRDDAGYHSCEVRAPAGTRYRFDVGGGRALPDPASRSQPEGVHGPSTVVDLARESPVRPFANPTLGEHVLYELHVGTFTPEGTFDAIVPRLGALRDLGVTAIELMPIAQFPGERNWGYDGVQPFAAQWSYGGIGGLRRLVDACHAHGLALVLDVVYNHLGPEGNYLAEFGPYFTDRYRTPWGASLNFDGPESDHVREFFIQSSLLWTRDCGVDGLRLDAVHAIVDRTARTFVEELTERVHDAAARQGRRVLVIAESSDNDPKLVRAPSAGGFGLDGCWNDDFHHAIRTALTGERRGYYASFGGAEEIATCVRDRFVFTGQHSVAMGRRHGAPAQDVPHARLVVFDQNHDQVGNRPLGDRLDHAADLAAARVAAALVILSPFVPMLWMGEEYADSAPFQYFVSHGDPQLIDAVRRGRAEEFAAFHDGTEPIEVPDPQDPETFRRSTLHWDARTQGAHAATLAYFSELLRLRRSLRIAARGDEVDAWSEGSVVVIRYRSAPRVLLAANVGRDRARLPRVTDAELENASYCVALDSDDLRWGGSGSTPSRGESARPDSLTPISAVLLRRDASVP